MRLSKLLQFPSVSSSAAPNHALDEAVFRDVITYLSDVYPLVWSLMEVEMVRTQRTYLGAQSPTRWRGSCALA